MKKKNKKENTIKFINFEKRFEIIGACVLMMIWVISFFAKISLSSINVEVERLSKEVKEQNKTNQSLAMKINELASLENIQSVANSEGLAYNNGNIIVVNEQ